MDEFLHFERSSYLFENADSCAASCVSGENDETMKILFSRSRNPENERATLQATEQTSTLAARCKERPAAPLAVPLAAQSFMASPRVNRRSKVLPPSSDDVAVALPLVLGVASAFGSEATATQPAAPWRSELTERGQTSKGSFPARRGEDTGFIFKD